jgi:hypothetical protein
MAKSSSSIEILILGLLLLGGLYCVLTLSAGQEVVKQQMLVPNSLSDLTDGGLEINWVAQPSPIVVRRQQVVDNVSAERAEWASHSRQLPNGKAVARLYWA